MAILDTDIKLMASERLTDEDDGGGMMSAVEVEDGVVNNLFPDISRLDRTYGRVNLRKSYAAVRTANKDMYYGSHAIVTDSPDDGRVSVLMFTTGSYTDERIDAQDHIESYVIKGQPSSYTLYGDQLAGQRMVKLYSRVDAKLPEVGKVYMLSPEGSGSVTSESQFVRVDTVDHEILEFEDDKGVFKRRVITLGIGSALRNTYNGPNTASRYSDVESATVFRETQVADASKYYGIVSLEESITSGDMSIKVDTIYGQLVPSATVESPVVDVQAGTDRLNIVAAGDAYSITLNRSSTMSFGRAVEPGTVELNYSNWLSRFEDDGDGAVICVSSSGPIYGVVGTQYGSIDYESGTVTDFSIGSSGNNVLFTAQPAAAIYDTAHTEHESITLANRGYNYVKTLNPIPQPGTLFVDYLAQGEWYRMQDNGSGVLEDEAGGAGTIDYSTGSVVATLGALPDTGGEVIYTWASPTHYEIRTVDPDLEPAWMVFTVSEGQIMPNSLSLSWESGGVTKTATDDGDGNITGDATGSVIYGLGQVGIQPLTIPDSGAVLSIDYDKGSIDAETVSSYVMSANNATFTVANAPIEPGTFAATFSQDWDYSEPTGWGIKDESGTHTVTVSDNGDGTLSNGGTINYATGYVSMPVNYSDSDGVSYYNGDYRIESRSGVINGNISVRYQQDSVTGIAESETAAIPDITIELTPTTTRSIVPGSIEFEWAGKTHFDREGVIYTDWDRQTGAATAVGVIDYSSGQIAFSSYTGGASNTITVKSMLTKYGDWIASKIFFRTPGSPLRPSSLYFRATKTDGLVIGLTPDAQGVIDTSDAQGVVNYETGVVSIEFGQYVLESTLTAAQRAEIWYDSDNILGDGTIWVPAPIEATTMKFNAVVYSMMPLDASILGLDPVRLPVDGRVPIIRGGDVGVIHSTKQEELPNPISADQSVTLSRDELAACHLIDQNGTVVDAAEYSVNRETGVVTMADPMDLSGLTEPLVAVHRIEDMVLVNEAQINGYLSLVGAVERDYDPADTYFSSALIFGDIGSRAHHLFSQSTWSGEWSDERIGNNTTAQYNDLLYPIQVDNKNAIRERWAIIFTGASTFNVVGEVSGQIHTGSITVDCSPVNPITGEPYFTILADGWGSGWSSNNVLRFNTNAAHAPIWIARTTISGKPTKEDDSFKLQIRGDAD